MNNGNSMVVARPEGVHDAIMHNDLEGLTSAEGTQEFTETPPPMANLCFVYFIGERAVAGPVKIGVAKDIERRIKALQTGFPGPLICLARTPGGIALEREYHRRFADHHRFGEWFTRAPAILVEIQRLRQIESEGVYRETMLQTYGPGWELRGTERSQRAQRGTSAAQFQTHWRLS